MNVIATRIKEEKIKKKKEIRLKENRKTTVNEKILKLKRFVDSDLDSDSD